MQKIARTAVYGLCGVEEKILVLIQKKGPFKGKYDFPGGGIEFGEEIEVALKREFKEEVALEFDSCVLLTNLTSTIDVPQSIEREAYTFYQIGLIYKVAGIHSLEIKDVDYLDNLWVDPKTLTENKCSPLLWKFLGS